MLIEPGVGSNRKRDFRSPCSLDSTVRRAHSDATETSASSRAAHCRKWKQNLVKNGMERSKHAMFKNPQKHWLFARCAGLRGVISLSSMRVRVWELTKIPPATLRTGLIDGPISPHGSRLVECLLESGNVTHWKLLFRTHSSHAIARLLTGFAQNRPSLRPTRSKHHVRALCPLSERSRNRANGGDLNSCQTGRPNRYFRQKPLSRGAWERSAT